LQAHLRESERQRQREREKERKRVREMLVELKHAIGLAKPRTRSCTTTSAVLAFLLAERYLNLEHAHI
jgi:hypothetical protein